ncbi:YraN family protein [Corynebacterium lizhenjunii]|uniref:YraN family protein n=1 Tax=Corynebacterium lizhenjunii TaxID=2709394 RepID=UPI0039A5B232
MITHKLSRTELGRKGEAFAARLYTARGATLLATNVRYPVGEIDLVCREADGTLVFVEVKTRSTAAFGVAEAVTPRKLARMRKAATRWLEGRAKLANVRFDVVALTVNGAGFDVEYFAGVEHGAG